MRRIADKTSDETKISPVDLGACTHITPLSAVAVVLSVLPVAASDLLSIDFPR
jgi:hypothetical protein